MATVQSPGHAAKLCSHCCRLELIIEGHLKSLEDYEDEWPDFHRLAQSAASGCDFCKKLRHCLVSSPDLMKRLGEGPRGVLISIRAFEHTVSWDPEKEMLYGIMVFIHPPGVGQRFEPIRLGTVFLFTNASRPINLASPKCVSSEYASQNSLLAPTAEVLSERNVCFIQGCIAESDDARESEALDLPTRLLDLSELAGGSVKLVVSRGIPGITRESVRYGALSYCWGDPETAKSQSITTANNLEDRKKGFDIQDLSPVIQDAIQVCTSLSIHFLWVDALCILQGDSRDWAEESQRLWEIFRGAFVTICAASSTSCQQGFLQPRPLQPGLDIKFATSKISQGSMQPSKLESIATCRIIPLPISAVVQNPDIGYGKDDTPFLGEVWRSRWLSRGWVDQEMAFSKRLLIFTPHWIFIRCGDLIACETGWRKRIYRDNSLSEVDLLTLRRNPFSHFWRVVRRFQFKGLTNKTDCLPAMAALARQVHRATGSEYLAGLWRDNLASDLLFQICAGHTLAPQDMLFQERLEELSDPGRHARPSWSWVGQRKRCGISGTRLRTQDDGVAWTQYDRLQWNLDCALLEAAIEPVNENPFGAVRQGHLTIQCRMINLKEVMSESEILSSTASVQVFDRVNFEWDTHNEFHEPREARLFVEHVSLICISKRPQTKNLDWEVMAGLIVYPAVSDGKYYRIGVWFQDWVVDSTRSCIRNHGDWPTQTITLV